jgi:putative aminopeptidase FrvX
MPVPKTLKALLSLPTAPFVEGAVMAYIERVCQHLAGVTTRYDRHGNLLARYRRRPAALPLAFVAHADHPGFVALEMADRRTVRAAFRGGVKPEYFTDARVRFWTSTADTGVGRYSAGQWVKGRVRELTKAARVTDVVGWIWRPEEALIRVGKPVAPNSPGMWDLPDPALRGDLITARGCDDIAGCAAMLTLLQRLSRKRIPAEVYCLFTRAEEVGFIGAIAAARAGTLPRRLPVISIETSSILPNAQQGDGPILRVGDRAAIFSPGLIAFCERVARTLAERRKGFAVQRKLMDGGICEAVPFMAYGYEAGGICLALGNYHNMDTRRKRIASETISLRDWHAMLDWFEALVCDTGERTDGVYSVRPRLDARFEKYADLLRDSRTPSLPCP